MRRVSDEIDYDPRQEGFIRPYLPHQSYDGSYMGEIEWAETMMQEEERLRLEREQNTIKKINEQHMITATTKDTGDFKVLPAGTHVARLYSIVHIGVLDEEYMGEPKQTDKIRLGFEVDEEKIGEGDNAKPMSVFDEFTLSMHEKANLRKFVEGIIGTQLRDDEAAAFDLEDLLGRTCMINVQHKVSRKGTTWPKIISVSPLPKSVTPPPATNDKFVFDVDSFDQSKFDTLPSFVQNKVKSSYNYKRANGLTSMPLASEFPEDEIDIPF
jgi:hypothetical protein